MDFFFIVVGYLFGSIPFGLLLTKLAGYGDIRELGSGNIGTTNVLRTGSKSLAILTLLADSLKGALAVWLSFSSGDVLIIFATALAAVLGHMYPIWLRFRGGKGVATTLGVMLMLQPNLGLAMCVIWLGVAVTLRYSSLAGLTAFASAPILSYIWLDNLDLAALSLLLALLVFWKHKGNIDRLLAGQESKIRFKKDRD